MQQNVLGQKQKNSNAEQSPDFGNFVSTNNVEKNKNPLEFSKFEILAQGVGRRKSATAMVKLIQGNGNLIINKKSGFEYLQQNSERLLVITQPLEFLQLQNKYSILVKVVGGGINSQLTAIQLAIAKAICTIQPSYKSYLKNKGYLTSDARRKERKKYGLKKARKAPQFSKR